MKLALKDLVTYAGMGGAAATIAAMGVLKGLDPKMSPELTALTSSPVWYLLPAVLMLIAGVAHFILKPKLAKEADLELRFHGGPLAPTGLRHVNVWRWYYYTFTTVLVPGTEKTPPLSSRPPTGKKKGRGTPAPSPTPEPVAIYGHCLLFLTFEPEVEVSNLRVTSTTPIPQWEVKEFYSRYAIIAFMQPPPACTVTVTVRPASAGRRDTADRAARRTGGVVEAAGVIAAMRGQGCSYAEAVQSHAGTGIFAAYVSLGPVLK